MHDDGKVRIDKAVPYPHRKRPGRFPFTAMDVGDSFVAEPSEKALIYYHMKMHVPKRFTTRTVRENGRFALRVWRIV